MGKNKAAASAATSSRHGQYLNDGRGRYQAIDSLDPQQVGSKSHRYIKLF